MNSLQIPSLRLEVQQVQDENCCGIEPLLIPVEFMRFCYSCNAEHLFVARLRCASGLIGCCSNCGDERIAFFTRSEGETGTWEAYT